LIPGWRHARNRRNSGDGLRRRLIRNDGYIDVFENLPGGDAENAVRKLDEVIAPAAGVLTSESIGKGEAAGELFGFNQEAGAIRDPGIRCFHIAGLLLSLLKLLLPSIW
jgi:hypothetical protein